MPDTLMKCLPWLSQINPSENDSGYGYETYHINITTSIKRIFTKRYFELAAKLIIFTGLLWYNPMIPTNEIQRKVTKYGIYTSGFSTS